MKRDSSRVRQVIALAGVLALGLAAIGCPSDGGSSFVDEDGDGWPAPADCCDSGLETGVPGCSPATAASIHPLAEEIAYDGIDQDCRGGDLKDYDRDGYDAVQVGGTDCDDSDPTVHPGAPEIPYDGIDQDCSGGDLVDADGDGSAAIRAGGQDCCDDGTEDSLGCSPETAASINPGAQEISYDGIDQNCDGLDYAGGPNDQDGDGFLTDRVPEGIDCDDSDPLIHPGAKERCNRIDDDCNGYVDEELPDLDMDGHPACCDCDDFDASIYPGAPEIPYDGIDQDCDGADLVDVDGDGYIALAAGGNDCDDFNPAIHPGAPEICNRIDDNCDGQADEAWAASGDGDGDGWYAQCDCDDTNPMINPWMPEVPNNFLDDNCNGLIDELDMDGDGYYAMLSGGDDCCDIGNEASPGCSPVTAASMHPGALEIPYDGIDQDCDGADLVDVDGDGHIAVQAGGDDCADWNPLAHPGRAEDCSDPDDNNCDGTVNEGCGPGADEDVRVDAGPFTMGRLADDTDFINQAPQHVVNLDLYFIDKYEVTISQYRRCAMAGVCSPVALVLGSITDPIYWLNQQRGLFPAVRVSHFDAAQYCAWVGKRLPTEAEWEKAARGPGARTQAYPWGDRQYSTPPAGEARVRLPVPCSLANHTHLCTGEPCEGDVVAVDRYPEGLSFYGLFNMAGNAAEWVSDYYQGDYYAISPVDNPTGPGNTGLKVVRGGHLGIWDPLIETTFRDYMNPGMSTHEIGFRCARVPPRGP